MDRWAEYRQAVEREQLVRDACFLPIIESIGPFDVKPMTLRHYLALRVVGSPFVCGGTPTPDDAFLFLWQVSPNYHPDNLKAKRILKRQCLAFIPRFPWVKTKAWRRQTEQRLKCFEEICKAIREYIREAFQDQPPKKGDGEGPSYFSLGANLVDTMAAEYGWPADVTLDQPLKRLFQYLVQIRARDRAKAGKPPIYFNPSDALLGRLVAEENSQN